ncbi:MAG: DUF6702 family protein [Verrucomicrobiales bacterium]
MFYRIYRSERVILIATGGFSGSSIGVKLKFHRVHPLRFLSCGWIAVLAMMLVAIGHPNHDAIAEVDWNSETGSLEVALRVNAHELERVVSTAAGKALDLDDATSTEPLKKYIAAKMRCLDGEGKPVEMKWVGAEIRVRSAWIYFEFPVGKLSEEAVTKCSLANTVFFDEYEDQTNTVAFRLRPDDGRSFYRFSKDRPIVKLSPAEEKDTQELKSSEPTVENE